MARTLKQHERNGVRLAGTAEAGNKVTLYYYSGVSLPACLRLHVFWRSSVQVVLFCCMAWPSLGLLLVRRFTIFLAH